MAKMILPYTDRHTNEAISCRRAVVRPFRIDRYLGDDMAFGSAGAIECYPRHSLRNLNLNYI